MSMIPIWTVFLTFLTIPLALSFLDSIVTMWHQVPMKKTTGIQQIGSRITAKILNTLTITTMAMYLYVLYLRSKVAR